MYEAKELVMKPTDPRHQPGTRRSPLHAQYSNHRWSHDCQAVARSACQKSLRKKTPTSTQLRAERIRGTCSKSPLEHVVLLDNTTSAHKALQLSTSRFMKEELSWIPLASWLEHNFRVETFGANSEDVPSGSSYDKLRGRFGLCVVK